ncbi:MAG: shikimate dehydrogenase [Bacteroidetes bacterium RBG_13_43_22]|nr:MAG: shikimate dehydrogenase [Bacteroidetes bacterium RBG_13_43_22]
MRKFGLIGYPLDHSFSAKYFSDKFAREGIIDSLYENFPLETLNRFPELISANPELCGLNVTIPYKTEIIQYLDDTESAIKEIGAVNVLKIRRSGNKVRISGFNSDVTGIKESIIPYVKTGTTNALVLGTGGSSKAVAYTLKKAGIFFTFVSRTKKKDCITYADLTPGILLNTELIINTTPLGMFPDIDKLPDIDYNLLSEKHILFDLVYNPEYTLFLKKGKERGCKIITGLKMLYAQAERSWEIWNGENL